MNSNSNVGVFGWIREGVRRAVLLGFSDAVEQIGAADDKDALHPQLQSLLRERRVACRLRIGLRSLRSTVTTVNAWAHVGSIASRRRRHDDTRRLKPRANA